MNLARNALATCSLLACLAASAAAQVSVPASKDNTLFNEPDGLLSNGSGQHVFAGRNNGIGPAPIRRGLFAFDVAAHVPAGAQVTSARLDLVVSMSVSGGVGMALHRVDQDWGEGASMAPAPEGGGAPSAPGDATWLHTFYPGSFWASPGGDFAATPSASTLVAGPGSYSWGPTPEMVADVQLWLDDPSQAFGWLLRGAEGIAGTAKRFESKDHLDPAVRPALVVDFLPPPQVYCTPQTSSSGCVPSIGWTGAPGPGGNLTLLGSQIEASQLGIAFYSLAGPSAQPFGGGTLCIQPPVTRLPVQPSGGSAPCAGSFATDLAPLVQSLAKGQVFWIQYWYRDPGAPSGTGLSDGLEVTVHG